MQLHVEGFLDRAGRACHMQLGCRSLADIESLRLEVLRDRCDGCRGRTELIPELLRRQELMVSRIAARIDRLHEFLELVAIAQVQYDSERDLRVLRKRARGARSE